MIKLWKFKDAPQHLKDLYPQGSEQTWVLEVPSTMIAEVQNVIRAASVRISELGTQEQPDGTVIFFGQNETQIKSNAS